MIRFAAALIPLGAMLALGGMCYAAAGVSLGLFIGVLGVASVIVPGMVLAEKSWCGRTVMGGAIVLGAGIVWAFAIGQADIGVGDWLRCWIVLIAYTIALVGLAAMLEHFRAPAVVACAVTVIVAMLWLSWPIWMSPWVQSERMVAWLVAGHPIFAINGALRIFPPWPTMPLAYGSLMNLNQDIAYEMPSGIGLCAVVHGVMGGGMLAAVRWGGWPRRPRGGQ